jgi:beta-glucosidase
LALAVIGVDAVEARLGGYSGPGISPVSILDGIRAKVGPAGAVRYAAGPGRVSREYEPVPSSALKSQTDSGVVAGLRGEYFPNNALDGAPALVRTDRQVNFGWTLNSPGRGIPYDWYSARWTGRLVAPVTGTVRFGVEGNDGYRLFVSYRSGWNGAGNTICGSNTSRARATRA